ncbi:hypothetical protein ACPPVT_08280 [Angustibacter sp. McL0619]|uniref:hypothetical protein n=1 Tax=Angustibacter sp. McL0619 TaxID=3415676 RepID=UPI003CEBCD30
MFGWIDRAAGHVPLPRRLARRDPQDVLVAAPATYPNPEPRRARLLVAGGTLVVLLLVLAPLTALMLRTGTGDQQSAGTANRAGPADAINVPPPLPERLMPPLSTGEDEVVAADGIELSATVQSDGTADVTETVTLSPQTRNLVLAVPSNATPPGAKPSQLDGPQALSVNATANGQVVGSPNRVGVTPVTVALPAGSNLVVLHYLLVGSTVRSTPSTAGRALTAIAPITARSQAGLALTIHLRGHDTDIRNLVCPAAGPKAATCAVQSEGRWRTTAELAAATSYALAQVDLPS